LTNKNKTKAKKGFSEKEKTLLDVNYVIDNILAKHKEKIDELHAKEVDMKKFSLKNKKGKTIYYLRKTSKKKSDEDSNSEILSKQIISDARSNLGIKPSDDTKESKVEYIDVESKDKQTEKPIRFDKENKVSIDEFLDDLPKSEDMVKSKEFGVVVSEIDGFLEDKADKKLDKNRDAKTDDKTNKSSEKDSPVGIKDDLVDKEEKATKKHGFFKKKKTLSNEDEKKADDADFISSSTDDLAEMKKKYKGNIEFSGIGSEIPDEKADKNESVIVDKKIKTTSDFVPLAEKKDVGGEKALKLAKGHLKDEAVVKKEPLIGTKKADSKEKNELVSDKKSFFKRKKSTLVEESENLKTDSDEGFDKSDFGVEELSKANIADEDESRLLDKQIEKTSLKIDDAKEKSSEDEEDLDVFQDKKACFKSKTLSVAKETEESARDLNTNQPAFKPKFRVENRPVADNLGGDDDASMLDEKIREDSDAKKNSEDDEQRIGEDKALKLAKKHISEQSFLEPQKKPLQDKKEKIDDGVVGSSLDIEKSEHEHVFFDESDDAFSGWSPKLSEDEKKKMPVPFNGSPEVVTDDFKSGSDVELPKDTLQTKSVTLSELGFSANEWEELDFYPLHEPFAFVEILREKESLEKCYFLVEIELTEREEKLLNFIQETMAQVAIFD